MNKVLFSVYMFSFVSLSAFSQTDKSWTLHSGNASTLSKDKAVTRLSFPKEYKLFDLNINPLKQDLFSITDNNPSKRSVIIALPNVAGKIEQFEVFEASNFEPALQSRFPEIRAFSGRGITDKSATLKLSISPQGIQSMVFRTGKNNEFIEPYSQDRKVYAVFNSYRKPGALPWRCSTVDEKLVTGLNREVASAGFTASSAGEVKTMRLAQSVTAEYSNYFGATNASQQSLVLAAINTTLTRANGVYEKDLAIHLNLIAATTDVFYYDPLTDPYSPDVIGALGAWNNELQRTLTNVIGSPNYDIGHLFGAAGGGGNAGCIGCVCVDPVLPTDDAKGSGFTSPADGIPQGDNFDIDYVVHEVGHQLGANHTFSHSNEGTGVNKEVGSGITIMGYAGITSQDVDDHSIAFFHEASIAQIQTNLAGKTCPVTTSLAGINATPVVAPVGNYSIPKSTPFVLTGTATDADPGDVLTYSWEQSDDGAGQTAANSNARTVKPTGPNFLSFPPTTSPLKFFPKLVTILQGKDTTGPQSGGDAATRIEALSSIARTLNFRLTVRDNSPYTTSPTVKIGQTAFTNMVVSVINTAEAFAVTIPNTNVSWPAGSSQTVTWSFAGSDLAPVNCANVRILFSSDGGLTFPTVLSAITPNDGTEMITIPQIATTTARIKVESVGNIFFDINNSDFTVTVPLPTLFTFTGNGNWDVPANWSGNNMPPATLGSGQEIIIDHAVGGVCNLNISQTISGSGILTIKAGKNLIIPGNLIRN